MDCIVLAPVLAFLILKTQPFSNNFASEEVVKVNGKPLAALMSIEHCFPP